VQRLPMKIITLTGTLTIVALCMIPLQQAIAQIANGTFLTYKDPQFGYSIDYPSGWVPFKFYNDPKTTLLFPSNDRSIVCIVTVNNTLAPTTTLSDMTKQFLPNNGSLNYFEQHKAHVLAYNTTGYYILGNPAIRYEYTAKVPFPITGEIHETVLGFIAIIDGKGYSLGFSAPASKFSNYTSIFTQMLYSFKPTTNAT